MGKLNVVVRIFIYVAAFLLAAMAVIFLITLIAPIGSIRLSEGLVFLAFLVILAPGPLLTWAMGVWPKTVIPAASLVVSWFVIPFVAGLLLERLVGCIGMSCLPEGVPGP